MSKPIACLVMVVSFATFPACSAADGGASSQPATMREGPRDAVLQQVPDDGPAKTKGPQPVTNGGGGASDEPSEEPATPRDSGRAVTVGVGAGAFSPSMINVHLGDSVEFTWQNGRHTVTSGFRCKADGMFASGNRAYPATYRVTFLRTGIFPFYSDQECMTMSGMITVTAPAS